jgi:hypothetical protein
MEIPLARQAQFLCSFTFPFVLVRMHSLGVLLGIAFLGINIIYNQIQRCSSNPSFTLQYYY